MSEIKNIVSRGTNDVEEIKQQEGAIRPAVDIFEDTMGTTVQADMPGVSKDRLSVRKESDTLSNEGEAKLPMPEGMEALYADFRSARYQSSFSLSNELDREKIDASLIDGVLTLRIPKREELRPRKIEVRIA